MRSFSWLGWLTEMLTRPRSRPNRARKCSRPAARCTILRLEYLEQRLAPAVHDLTTSSVFSTIQAAVNAANPGDTLLADAGIYAENVTINKSLTLEGASSPASPPTTTISGTSGTGIAVTGATVTLDDLVITGFTTGLTAGGGTTTLSLTDFYSGSTFGGTITGVSTVNVTGTASNNSLSRINTFNVNGTSFSVNGEQNISYTGVTTLNLTGGASNDIFNIGASSNSLAAIQSAINIDGGGNEATPTVTQSIGVNGTTMNSTLPVGDVVQVIDYLDANSGTYRLTANTVQRAGTGLITLKNVETLNAFFAPGGDTVNVESTPAAATTLYSFGFDIFNVTTTAAAGTLLIYAAMAGSAVNVTSTGAGSMLLVHGNSGSDQMSLYGTGAASGVHFDGYGGTDLVVIRATATASLTEITEGSNASDRGFFVVGSTANSLSGILGFVSFAGGGGTENLTLSDQGETAQRTYELTANELSRSGAAACFYSGMTALTVYGSQGDNQSFKVSSKAVATATGVYAGNGINFFSVTVDPGSGYGALLIQGGTGVDYLVADIQRSAVFQNNMDSPSSGVLVVIYRSPGALQSQIAYKKIASASPRYPIQPG